MSEARAFWVTEPGRGEIRREPLSTRHDDAFARDMLVHVLAEANA